MTTTTPITLDQFRAFTRPLLGLPVTRPWRGYGSAVFLDLGKLRQSRRKEVNGRGEAVVMIAWSWRVESMRAIRFGSFSADRKMTNGIKSLEGSKVEDITLACRLPELSIRLSKGQWLHSFMTAEGQPEWTVFLPDRSWLTVMNGKLVRQRGLEGRKSGSN